MSSYPEATLSKKLFPVGQVGKKTASWEVGFFIKKILIFFLTRMYRGRSKKKKCSKKMKKKVPVLLDPPGRYTVNNFFFKGGLTTAGSRAACEAPRVTLWPVVGSGPHVMG